MFLRLVKRQQKMTIPGIDECFNRQTSDGKLRLRAFWFDEETILAERNLTSDVYLKTDDRNVRAVFVIG